MEKPVQRHVDDPAPLRLGHAGHRRIVMDARVVDHDLHWTIGEQCLHLGARGVPIGDIECHRLRAAVHCADCLHHRFSAI